MRSKVYVPSEGSTADPTRTAEEGLPGREDWRFARCVGSTSMFTRVPSASVMTSSKTSSVGARYLVSSNSVSVR